MRLGEIELIIRRITGGGQSRSVISTSQCSPNSGTLRLRLSFTFHCFTAISFDSKRSLFEAASSTPKAEQIQHNCKRISFYCVDVDKRSAASARRWQTRAMANPAAGRAPNQTPSACANKPMQYDYSRPYNPATVHKSNIDELSRRSADITVKQNTPLPELPPMQVWCLSLDLSKSHTL